MDQKQITIAVVAPQEPFEFFDAFWEGVCSAAYELTPLSVECLTYAVEAPTVPGQEEVLRTLLEQQIHAVVVFPAHPSRLDHLIAEHTGRGTRVITAYADAPQSQRLASISPDSRMAGSLAGELLSKMLPPKSHIVALTGVPGSSASDRDWTSHLQARYEGFREGIRASGVPFAISEFEDPTLFVEALSGRRRAFDGLYLGCEELFESKQILDLVRAPSRCVSFNLTETARSYLRAGTLCTVVDSDLYVHGYLAVQKAFESVTSTGFEKSVIVVPSRIVMASNADSRTHDSSVAAVFESLVRSRTMQLRSAKDILEAAQSGLSLAALNNGVIGLLDGRTFEQLTEAAIMETRATAVGAAVLVVHVDGFRSLQGPGADADRVLQQIAASIRSECRHEDAIARLGEGQFAILLTGLSEANAEAARQRISAAVSATRMPDELTIGSASLGIRGGVGMAFWNKAFQSATDLITEACEDLQTSRFCRVLLQNAEPDTAVSERRS